MVTLTQGPRAAECILSEANGHRSRDSITIKSGAGVVPANTVVGEITAEPGKYEPSPDTGATGTETATAVTLHDVDATSSDVDVAALTRDSEVIGAVLNFDPSVDSDVKKAAKAEELKAVNIIVR